MRQRLRRWVDREIDLEESDHARNAGSAWRATVFTIAGLLVVGYHARLVTDIWAQCALTLVIALLTFAACMFVETQFDLRWESSDNSNVLRAIRARLLNGPLPPKHDLEVEDGRTHPRFVASALSAGATERSRHLRKALSCLLRPGRWHVVDRRARSEVPCYVGIALAALLAQAAIWFWHATASTTSGAPGPRGGNIMSADGVRLIVDIAVTAGTLLVAVSAVWGHVWRARWAGPLLSIKPQNLLGLETELHDRETGQLIDRVLFYHLRVVNRRHAAPGISCRVLLTGVQRLKHDNRFHPEPVEVPPQLAWSPREFTLPQQTIADKAPFALGSVRATDLVFRPFAYWVPSNFRGFVGPGETVRYTLTIMADNFVDRRPRNFEVAWAPGPVATLDEAQAAITVREV
jgi:hypothetical protein